MDAMIKIPFLSRLNREEFISFCLPPPDISLVPIEEVQETFQHVFEKQGQAILGYHDAQGLLELRQWIADRVSRERMAVSADEVVITTGIHPGLQLAIRAFETPSRVIYTEDPSYLHYAGVAESLKTVGFSMRSIPLDKQGFSVAVLKNQLKKDKSKKPPIVLLTPDFQNPTMTILSVSRRKELGRLAEKRRIIVIEDVVYRDFASSGVRLPPPIRAFSDQAVMVGTFSKTIFPDMRVGWLIVPQGLVGRVTKIRRGLDNFTSYLNQWFVWEYASTGKMAETLKAAKKRYDQRRTALIQALARHKLKKYLYVEPKGGFFAWLQVPCPPEKMTELLETATSTYQIDFTLGEGFFETRPKAGFIRLSFCCLSPASIERGINHLSRLLRQCI